MSDYPEFTPTTEQVRSAYAHDPEAEYRDPVGFPAMQRENLRAFDRWLAAHDAQKRAEWEAERDKPDPCVMTHTPPFDFAQCETHDETFPLGGGSRLR